MQWAVLGVVSQQSNGSEEFAQTGNPSESLATCPAADARFQNGTIAVRRRVLAQIVYEATPRDPVVFVGVMLTMTLRGLIATWIPARRAIGIDPAGLLREE